MNQRGNSLVESLVSIGILGLLVIGILPAFMSQLDANSRSESRSAAVVAAEVEFEDLRVQDPASMPMSGSSAVKLIPVGNRSFEVVTHYCERNEFCDANSSRYLRVEVRYKGRGIYGAETIFAQLR